MILARCLAHGMRGYVLDRAGHYAFLCSLIPGARHLTIGGAEDEHAVNPWDVADPARPPAEKVTYLVGLHALLVGDHRAGDDSYGLDALERNLLEVAIRAVYAARRARAARAARVAAARRAAPPRRPGGQRRRERGGVEAAHAAERLASFCGDGSLRLPARPPHHRARRRAAGRLRHPQGAQRGRAGGAVRARRARLAADRAASATERLYDRDAGVFAGRSVLVIDEAWKLVERRATGEWVNDLARRARHLGLFLVAISPAAVRLRRRVRQGADPQLDHAAVPAPGARRARLRRRTRCGSPTPEIRAIARLKTVKRSFSQAYWINGTRGRGTIALRVGPTEYWLATSDPVGDAPLRAQALEDAGGDPWRALERLAARGLVEGDD